jgi:6-phosphogluconolactonase
MAMHPSNGKIYLLNELSNILSVHTVSADGSWETLQRLSTLPRLFNSENTAAHIHISKDGQFIYTSNRGHNSIAVFKIVAEGLIELIQIVPCGGAGPRFFTLLESSSRLIVAHEQTDSLAAFAVRLDGCLVDTLARGYVPKPTFVMAE